MRSGLLLNLKLIYYFVLLHETWSLAKFVVLYFTLLNAFFSNYNK